MTFLTSLTLCLCVCVQDDLPEKFESEEGKFTAQFPGKPKKTVQNIPTAVGTIKTNFFMHESASGAFAVAYSDYPKDHVKNSGVENVLKGAREGAAKNIGGKVVSHKAITLDKHKGQHVVISSDKTGLEIHVRHYFNGDRMYQALVVGQKGKVDNDKTKKFLESFKIK